METTKLPRNLWITSKSVPFVCLPPHRAQFARGRNKKKRQNKNRFSPQQNPQHLLILEIVFFSWFMIQFCYNVRVHCQPAKWYAQLMKQKLLYLVPPPCASPNGEMKHTHNFPPCPQWAACQRSILLGRWNCPTDVYRFHGHLRTHQLPANFDGRFAAKAKSLPFFNFFS